MTTVSSVVLSRESSFHPHPTSRKSQWVSLSLPPPVSVVVCTDFYSILLLERKLTFVSNLGGGLGGEMGRGGVRPSDTCSTGVSSSSFTSPSSGEDVANPLYGRPLSGE
jgi:hypothetical protein